MSVDVGAIVEGKVTGITKFGAFIDLGNGMTGLCHISEIADSYVREVGDHLQNGQAVTVKVITVDPRGKVSLSIRQAVEKPAGAPEPRNAPRQEFSRESGGYGERRSYSDNRRGPRSSGPKGFEDLLSGFMKDSDDKLRDFKKQKSNRRGNGYNNR